MNPFSILLFSLILFLSRGMAVALTTYSLGVPSFEKWHPISLFLILNGPACFVLIIVFYFLARKQLVRPYVHAFFVFVIAELLNIFATSLITKQLSYSPTWMFDLPISMVALFVGMALGIKRNQWQKEYEMIESKMKDKKHESKK